MSLQIPSLQPKAAPVDTYVRAGSPNAPGAVSLGELAKLPEPAEIQNTKNLVNSLSSLNTNLQNVASSFFQYQGELEKKAEADAEKYVAEDYLKKEPTLKPLDKVRDKAEDEVEKTQDPSAKDRYSLARNLDPRTDYYYQKALQKRQGLEAIYGLTPYLKSLKGDDGESIILNPNPPEGEPNRFNEAVQEYIRNNISDPEVLAELTPQLQAQIGNSRAALSTIFADEQDRRINETFDINLANSINQNLITGDGSTFKGLFDTHKNSGSSKKSYSTKKTNFIDNLAKQLAASTDDRYELEKRIELFTSELLNTRVGPGDNPPLLINELGGEAKVRADLKAKTLEIQATYDRYADQGAVKKGEDYQNQLFDEAIARFTDSDPETEELDPFEVKTPGGIISQEIDLTGMQQWEREQRKEINKLSNHHEREGRLNILSSRMEIWRNGRGIDMKDSNNDLLQERIDNGMANPTELLAEIRFYHKNNLITRDQRNYLRSQVAPVKTQEDKDFTKAIMDQEKNSILKLLNKRAENDVLMVGESSPGVISANEGLLINITTRKYRVEANKVRELNIPYEEKIEKLSIIYKQAEEEIANSLSITTKVSQGIHSGDLIQGYNSGGLGVPIIDRNRPVNKPPTAVEFYGETPDALLYNLAGGNRGDAAENVRLKSYTEKSPLYSKEVFVEQLNQLEEGTPLSQIPFGSSTQKIISRSGLTVFDYIRYQIKAHGLQEQTAPMMQRLEELLALTTSEDVLIAGNPSFDIDSSRSTLRRSKMFNKLKNNPSANEVETIKRMLGGNVELPNV